MPANTSRQLDAEGNVVREFRENKDAEMAKRTVSVFSLSGMIVEFVLRPHREERVLISLCGIAAVASAVDAGSA